MPPNALSEWRRGWPAVVGAGVGLGTGILFYLMVMSLFVTPLTREFGWSRADMGTANMVAFAAGAVALPIVGRLLDRFGIRPIVLVSAPALAVVYLLITLQPGDFRIHLLLMTLGGIFGAGTGAVTYTRPVIAIFRRQRGLALGLATAGTSITGMIAPPLLGHVISAYGWREGMYAMALLTASIGLPIALSLIGRAREAGAAGVSASAVATPMSASRTFKRDMTLGQAVRGIRFWLLAIGLVAVNIPGSGVVGHLAALLGDKGLPEESAAFVMSFYAAGLLAGRLITGLSLDRLPASAVAGLMTIVPAIGVLLLLVPSASFAVAAAAGLLIGLQQGSEVDLVAYLVSRRFGTTHYSTIFAALGVAGALSTGGAMVFFGRVHDRTGSYDAALIIGVAAFLVGAAAFWAVSRVRDAQVSQVLTRRVPVFNPPRQSQSRYRSSAP